jgi:CDP-paratose 2-epimerase
MRNTRAEYPDNSRQIYASIEKEKRYEFGDEKYKSGIPGQFPTDLCEHTPYGCSKFAGDIYVQDYAQRNEINAGVFRMSCIYGTRQFGVEDQGWVAWFIIAILLKKPITIYGDGKQVRDVLYVSDLVRAYDSFVTQKIEKGVYNMGGGPENTISLLELLDIIEKKTGKEAEISFDDWRPSDQKVYISNISKAKKELEWEPKIRPEKGVEKLIDWVMTNKQLFS